jgi:two-component system, NtrC family, sensor kinase
MKRLKLLVIIISILLYFKVNAQTIQTDSLIAALKTAVDDTSKVNALINLSGRLLTSNTDEALLYANEAKTLAEKLGFKTGLAYSLKSIGMCYYFQANYIEALLFWNQSLSAFQSIGDKLGMANMLNNLGAVNFNQGDDEKAIEYYLESLKISEEIGDKLRIATALVNIGAVYFNKVGTHDLALQYYMKALILSEELLNQDAIGTSAVNIGEIYLTRKDENSALNYFEKALEAYKKSENGNVPYAMYNIGRVYAQRNDLNRAISYQQEAYNLAKTLNRKKEMSQTLLGLADAYNKKGENNSAISAFLKSQEIAQEIGSNYELKKAYEGLAELYGKSSDYKNAFKYQKLFTDLKDTLYNAEMDKRIQTMTLNFDLQKKQTQLDLLEKDRIQKVQKSRNQQLWIFSISGALISAIILSLVLYRNNQNKQKSNTLLQIQKEEIQQTLEKLRSTQSQLIQSEKMASLGELTAGIAHEIQNPLNFVNNFSEISNELVDEMKEELAEGCKQYAVGSRQSGEEKLKLAEEIANDIKQNLEKINHHGKRAAEIVKGMLQHSRTGSGQKELTDINTLADEYLRLSYHGLKAKDKSFNAEYKTEFDPNLPKINVVPQDIGRVLVNLINNAFYAVDKRAKEIDPLAHEGGMKNDQIKFVPTVTVSTTSLNPPSRGRGVKIIVKDNGPGINKNIVDKIFQPFFTTKPTGQGTGLGLSLAYDIVKAHGGEIRVETKETCPEDPVGRRDGTAFIIQLPYL